MEAPRTLGGYRIRRHLATGGMAEVYLAESAVGRQVVLKRIKPKLAEDPSYVDLFLREATISLRVSHPRIAQVFDFGEAEGTFFLVMEYVEGVPLSQVEALCLERGVRMPWTLAASVVADVAGALDHVHRLNDDAGRPLGIVHRDVSPQNVIVGRDGQVKLVDFGVARSPLLKEVTEAGTTRGKYRYFAPEQVRRGTVDARTDVYACGVLLYELLTGRLPFEGELFAVLDAIVQGRYLPAEEAEPSIPSELGALVSWAMAKDPAGRPPRAADLESELTRWLRGQAPGQTERDLAAFVSGLSSVQLPPRERRSLPLLALLGAPAVLAGLLVGFVLLDQPDTEAIRQVEALQALSPLAPAPPVFTDAQVQQLEEDRRAAMREVVWRLDQDTGIYHGVLPVEKIALETDSLPWAGQALPEQGRVFARATGGVNLGASISREVLFRARGACKERIGVLRAGDRVELTGCTWVGFVLGDPYRCENNSESIRVDVRRDGVRHASVVVDGREHCLGGTQLDRRVAGAGFVKDGTLAHYVLEVDLADLEGGEPPHLAFLVERPRYSLNALGAVGFAGAYRAEDAGRALVLPAIVGLWAFVLHDDPPPTGTVRARLRPNLETPGVGTVMTGGHVTLPELPW